MTHTNEDDKLIVYEKGELVYIFNFHPNNSYKDYLVGTHWRSPHMILMETDEARFGGHQRLNDGRDKWIKVKEDGWHERRHSMLLYIPARTAIVLAPYEFAKKYKDVKMPAFEKSDPDFK